MNNIYKSTDLVVRKIDSITKEPIANAVFELNSLQKTSDAEGIIMYSVYPCGKYTLREVEPPEGYEPITTEYNITVDRYANVFVDGVQTNSIIIENVAQTPMSEVDYFSNGGQGEYIDSQIAYGTLYVIKSAYSIGITAPSGSYFASWNTEADGSGISYMPNDIVEIDGKLQLYAIWYQRISINYVKNDPDQVSVFVDTTRSDTLYTIKDISETTIVWEGHTFLSWNDKANGKGVTYNPGDTLMITAFFRIYAQWKLDE